ncbi:hypothetical protein XcvCFBP7111P_21825 [Xanthomonas citri pv. vignicola]|uniref:Uncharacterized protein n=1 Tax=Xanthomonas citri pv. vignicola TaxID=473426 RepID=A0AB33CT84_XANCI|nr:hypothetical protein XcvCFBP7111P_21825 [Xanthomonas citri pv. vignicola]
MAAVLGLFQEGVAMSTAPSMPASVPVDLLPASAHRLRWNVREVLHRFAAHAAVEQASDAPRYPLSRQLAVLPHTSRRLYACADVMLQCCVASRITHHHAEAS